MSMKTRITSNRITELRPDEIFVFGSNLEGAHGGGAAYLAWKKWGAIWGQGTGLQGQTYGIYMGKQKAIIVGFTVEIISSTGSVRHILSLIWK